MNWSIEKKTSLLLGLFVACIVAANLISLKIATFGFFEASVGVLFFPVLFLITDIVAEVHGKEKAKEFVYVGVLALVLVLVVTSIAVLLPTAERSFISGEDYANIFGTTMRIFVASIIAFFISQLHDVWAFHFWKEKTGGRYLWLRNNASTVISQFLDTTIFMFLAFYALTPKFTVEYTFALIVPYWLVKVGFAFFDTPFCYLGVKWLKGK